MLTKHLNFSLISIICCMRYGGAINVQRYLSNYPEKTPFWIYVWKQFLSKGESSSSCFTISCLLSSRNRLLSADTSLLDQLTSWLPCAEPQESLNGVLWWILPRTATYWFICLHSFACSKAISDCDCDWTSEHISERASAGIEIPSKMEVAPSLLKGLLR